jgi:hypothetical protein
LKKDLEGLPMKIIVIDQNEVKSYLVLSSGVLYITKEVITSRDITNIIINFSGGQVLKIPLTTEVAEVVYLDIQNVLGT